LRRIFGLYLLLGVHHVQQGTLDLLAVSSLQVGFLFEQRYFRLGLGTGFAYRGILGPYLFEDACGGLTERVKLRGDRGE
jgi:hypothetical protein